MEELEKLKAAEKALGGKLAKLQEPKKHDGAWIKKTNEVRRAKGELWMAMQEEEHGPLPTIGRTYRDGYRGITMNRTQSGRNRRIRVFKHNGHLKEDGAVLVLTPDMANKFCRMGAEVWVEPHPGYRNSWQLVGVYNFRDERIK